MKSIVKYLLKADRPRSPIIIALSERAEILHFGYHDDSFYMWAEIDLSQFCTEDRVFYIYGTEWYIEDDSDEYIQTTQAGDCVWHLYERKKK